MLSPNKFEKIINYHFPITFFICLFGPSKKIRDIIAICRNANSFIYIYIVSILTINKKLNVINK